MVYKVVFRAVEVSGAREVVALKRFKATLLPEAGRSAAKLAANAAELADILTEVKIMKRCRCVLSSQAL